MRKKLFPIIMFFPLFTLGQNTISFETITEKKIQLQQQGRIEGVNVKISYFNNNKNIINPDIWLDSFIDTIKEESGQYAIGRIIIDPFMTYDQIRVGYWKFYYPNGHLYSCGNFSIGALINCGVAGYQIESYFFRTGEWKFFYPNKSKKAIGNYDVSSTPYNTSCQMDSVFVSKVTTGWKFFDNNGRKQKATPQLIEEMENSR